MVKQTVDQCKGSLIKRTITLIHKELDKASNLPNDNLEAIECFEKKINILLNICNILNK